MSSDEATLSANERIVSRIMEPSVRGLMRGRRARVAASALAASPGVKVSVCVCCPTPP